MLLFSLHFKTADVTIALLKSLEIFLAEETGFDVFRLRLVIVRNITHHTSKLESKSVWFIVSLFDLCDTLVEDPFEANRSLQSSEN